VTDDGAVETLAKLLAASSRIALVSVMEHSVERSRFPSAAAHRAFYAADWRVGLDEVDRILAAKGAGSAVAEDRRREVAAMARDAGVVLATHDDRDPDDVDAASALGARVVEFPLTLAAAQRARELGMTTVLGAPNAVRGRSTSVGNLLVDDAIAAGVCDVLCSDYLPSALQAATLALETREMLTLDRAVDLVAAHPAAVLNVMPPMIAVGVPLTASLRRPVAGVHIGMALWRDGLLTYLRRGGLVC
jgi:alpha-D-ribose 1-methylphosphonate 5-triphosphate diphosphatase